MDTNEKNPKKPIEYVKIREKVVTIKKISVW